MSAAAVMLVKDEADIIEATVRHLASQVDEILVWDNLSSDGTSDILDGLAREGLPVVVELDREVGYYQDTKTTAAARIALDRGHQWVVPCDADEVWYAPDGRPVGKYLAGVGRDVQIVQAQLFNHLPSSLDDQADVVPTRRIGWRQREHAPLPKVCARCRPDLRIHMGNHGASTDGSALTVGGLVIRHFSFRTAEQYVRKIRNGETAYGSAPERAGFGDHWRAFEGKPDEAIADHFHRWFWMSQPDRDDSLIYDPAPTGWPS